jgi:hypothetical protein
MAGKFRIVFAAAIAAVAAGCGLFWNDPYVTVTENPLNWVEIGFYNATKEPVRRTRIMIKGDGFVEVRTGTSRLVSDPFANAPSDDTWDDYDVSTIRTDPAHIKSLFQELVNNDLFDKDKWNKKTDKPSPGMVLVVRAAINGKMYSEPVNQFEDDPALAELLYNIVLEFRQSAFGLRRSM